MARVLVVYYSATGNTEAMAEAVAEGAKEVTGTEVIMKKAEEALVNDIIAADAIAFGSPTYFSYMAGVLKTLFDRAYLSRSQITGKPFAAFASGGGGQERALESIERIGASCRLQKACPGVAMGGMPTQSQKQACKSLGTALARAIK